MNPIRLTRRTFSAMERRATPMLAASRAGFKNPLTQFREMSALRWGPTHLSSLEYLTMRLYDNEMHANPEGAQYGGAWFKEWIHAQLNNIRWEGMATDKASMYALFKQLGIPHPEVLAIATPQARCYGEIPNLRSREELALYLRECSDYPLFCKPIKGSKAAGSHRLESYDSECDELLLATGERVNPDSFAAGLEEPTGFGLLFQRALNAAPETASLCGNTIAGCRIVMLLGDSGAKPFKVTWKIPVGNNFIDNFCAGRSGNLAASVEPLSGRVQRVIRGVGMDLYECTQHPDTGAELLGHQLPYWGEVLREVTHAAESFPDFRWQHWDVGLSEQGPVLFELNSAGAVDLIQIAEGAGIYNAELRAFLKRYGNRERSGGMVFPERQHRPNPSQSTTDKNVPLGSHANQA